MTARAAFKQADVTRAIRAAKAAGVRDVRIEVEPGGKIVILAGQLARTERNPWDDDE